MTKNVAILGGGLAGLSVAYHSQSKHEITLFEKESETGGFCRSINENGYIFDYGPHFISKGNPYFTKLCEKLLGDRLIERKRNSYIFLKNQFTKFPFGNHLKGMSLKLILECVLGFMFRSKKKPRNMREWIKANNGYGIAKHMMVPYNEKIWKYPLEKIDISWINEVVYKPKISEIVKGALGVGKKEFHYMNDFYYPKKGIQELPRALEKELKVKLNLDSKIEKIGAKKEKVYVTSKKGTESFDEAVLTFPLPELKKVMKLPTKVEKAIDELLFNSLITVNIGLDAEPLTGDKQWIFVPEKEYIFHRVSFPSVISKTVVPKGKHSLQAEIRILGEPKSKEYYMERVVNDLLKAGVIRSREDIDMIKVEFFKFGYALYDMKRKKNLKIIDEFLNKNKIRTLGRFSRWEYNNMTQSILNGKEIAGKL